MQQLSRLNGGGIKIKTLLLLLTLTTNTLFAGFSFNTCSGSGTFEQQIVHYAGDYENTTTVGEIPKGIKGLKIYLISSKDVDIRLYGENEDKVVHWPNGIHNQSNQQTKPYKDVNVTYSGYNGVGGKRGHEFIEIHGSTATSMTMKAFGYKAGYATVNYSWTGKDDCTPSDSGTGTFQQTILNKATNLVGTIPPNVENIEINLTSVNDLDIQLYAQDGTAIARWKPAGLMAGSNKQSIIYNDMNITWSGYNGTGGQQGHEYIAIEGNTTQMLIMKVYGYQAGVADVVYSWGEKQIVPTVEELKKILDDTTIPYATEEDFNATEYAKNHLDNEEAKKLEREHYLVATAIDPEPRWFYTKVDKSVVMAKAGEDFTVHLSKLTKDNQDIGAVDNEKLRLVVRIQRGKDDFEYVNNVNIDTYAHWDGQGVLKIHVPDDLDKGRLLVGVRPNLTDVAASAIAERWSTVIVAEVWQTKQNVITAQNENVLFPMDNNTTNVLSSESQFTLAHIANAVKSRLDNNATLPLPMVVKEMSLQKDDLISYFFQGKPYAGKVMHIEVVGNQQFVLLAPTLFEIYDITDADDGFMIREGLYPEHVIIREGDRLDTDRNESDPTKFEKSSTKGASLPDMVKYFNQHCAQGKGVITLNTEFTLEPQVDMGINFNIYGLNKDTECTWEASSNKLTLNPAYFAVGGPLAIAMKAIGMHGELSPFGNISLATKDALGVGLDVGYSARKGGNFKMNYPRALGSRDLSDASEVAEVELSSTFGVKFAVKAFTAEQGIGWVLALLGINLEGIGLEAESGLKASFVAKGKNASEVQKSGSSELAIALAVEAKVTPTLAMKNCIAYMVNDSIVLDLKSSVVLIDSLKGTADFTYASVEDNGQGHAGIVGLDLTSYWLHKILPESKGVLTLTNSSVYNEHSEDISYNIDECNDKIISPAIGCAGWMCGVVDRDVELCKGKLTITKVIASAKVGQLASSGASIYNKSNETVQVSVSGSLLVPQETSVEIEANSGKYVVFEKVCSIKGAFRGTSTVTSQSGLSAEAEQIMVCHKDENKGDPHIVTGDGLGYDYFASGDYILSRIKGVSGYEIQGRFLPGFKTSWPQAVSLKVGNDRVEIQGVLSDGHGDGSGVKINALAIWINGKKYHEEGHSSYPSNHNVNSKIISLPSGGLLAISETKSSNVLTFPTSITVIWPKGSQAENYGVVLNVAAYPTSPFVEMLIARPDDFSGQEEGLLGNNDGDPKNDFTRRNGEVLGVDHNISFTELYALFGTDWLARPYESLFRNPEAIKPEFPTGVVTLTPEQRALGEEACRGLTGFYREACIIDVGLTGSVELVKEYYANTEDLNNLSDAIITPDTDRARYSMSVADKVYTPSSGYYLHYKQDINISHEAGEGNFMLLVRPPRGATVSLANGTTSHVAEGNFSTTLEVDCTELNTGNNSEFLQATGSMQLWLQDPLSGTAKHLVSQVSLPCTDESRRPQYSMTRGTKVEDSDSNDTHLHYMQTLSIIDSSQDKGQYILGFTAPKGAILKPAGSSTELNTTGIGDLNATFELDCTSLDETKGLKGNITLWEKDMLSGDKGFVYASYGLSCRKSKLLKTGQTISYTDFDDGYYQKGDTREYSRDNIKEIVTDKVTGLLWQDNAEAKTVPKNWEDAKLYCAELTLGSHGDWRLPTRKELGTLIDYGRVSPAIDPVFDNVASNLYWSSTTVAGGSSFAWFVNFYSGYPNSRTKTNSYYVRCVRAGQ